MVVIFVAATIIALLAIDYFFIHPKRVQKAEEMSIGELIPLSKTLRDIPAGVFLQPTFTWTRVKEDGTLVLGLHPLILGLIGPPYEIELLQDKEYVEKGDPLLRVIKDGRQVTIASPVAGEVMKYNQALLGETDWENLNMSWLYRIKPQNISAELNNWQYSEDAGQWMNQRFQDVKSFVFDKLAPTDVGMTMADGGDMPVGILSKLDDQQWNEFKDQFLR
ncbi:MAG: hypothetical protein K9N46_12560 [Candidatus Marinimicrobia bacterium]|nr:hypothetical protein [Candidatus Neomarinimicrobiota bacterium]MCF7827576.1 hypothetical protein [Candidatus Neomarinimicrobiota bacterium]MCF7881562.1 hypothetical protein [Candidatus Neomarinimicrobiota bacterium]